MTLNVIDIEFVQCASCQAGMEAELIRMTSNDVGCAAHAVSRAVPVPQLFCPHQRFSTAYIARAVSTLADQWTDLHFEAGCAMGRGIAALIYGA